MCGAPSVKSPLSRAWTYALFCISMATVPAMSPKLLVHHQPAGQQKKRRKKFGKFSVLVSFIIKTRNIMEVGASQLRHIAYVKHYET